MRASITFVLGLVSGLGCTAVLAESDAATSGNHGHTMAKQHEHMDHAAMGHDKMEHSMVHEEPLEVDAATAPTLDIKVTKDPMAGYNLQVMVDRFAFAPQSASLAHVAGEGHAHVYANGVKLSRLYGEWMHLDNLPKGDVEIEVSLNANDHRPLALNGVQIVAKTMITVD